MWSVDGYLCCLFDVVYSPKKHLKTAATLQNSDNKYNKTTIKLFLWVNYIPKHIILSYLLYKQNENHTAKQTLSSNLCNPV